jgi:hypothetical protein
MRRMWAVVRADGKVYAGISDISRDAMWFDYDSNVVELPQITKFKRDPRWLAQAQKSEPSAYWMEA